MSRLIFHQYYVHEVFPTIFRFSLLLTIHLRKLRLVFSRSGPYNVQRNITHLIYNTSYFSIISLLEATQLIGVFRNLLIHS